MLQRLKNIYHYIQAFLAALYFNFPSKSLTIIGVTGTDGKTTTVNILFHIFKNAGYKVSMVSSVGAQIGLKHLDTGFHVTTPSPFHVQKLLRKAQDSGSRYFILEATSHGLEQNRLAFIDFNVAVATNITSDHMDYHKNWQNYATAKAKLFKNVQYSILNMDDDSYGFLKNKASGKQIGYSIWKNADFNLKKFPLKSKFGEEYNLSNSLAAVSAASLLGVSKRKILSAIQTFSGVPGRMQEVGAGQKFKAIIDFAHTPNSLEKALTELKKKKLPKSKLIAVFGAAGERDKTKRPLMGEIAASLADISIITAEDPRRENPDSIIGQISQGFQKRKKIINADYYQISDRSKAINFAVNLAETQDTVAFFGKGHEKSMCFGKKEYPWDEVKEVKKAIERKLKDGK
jgi:UDP-N-acetylmuramoyl-L-alanyl-D-glutamate--2,6-diaminopimelate ligase